MEMSVWRGLAVYKKKSKSHFPTEGRVIKTMLLHLVYCSLGKASSLVVHTARTYPSFFSINQLGMFLFPPGWDASPSQGYPQHYFASTHSYTWVERGTMRVKYFAQEHNTMASARAQTWTIQSRVQRASHYCF